MYVYRQKIFKGQTELKYIKLKSNKDRFHLAHWRSLNAMHFNVRASKK